MNFPERLKIVIDKTGLTREEFYGRVNLSKSQLFNYLAGRSEPTLSFFQRLKAEFPWVDLEWLQIDGSISCTPHSPRSAAVAANFEALNEDDKKAVEQIAATLAECQKITRKAG